MASIYYTKLNGKLKKAILSKQYSIEELRAIRDKLKENQAERERGFKIATVMFIAIMAFMVWSTYSALGMSDVFLFTAVSCVVALIAILALVWVLLIGIVKMQFNGTVRKAYPEDAEQLKL